jgi:hypothetical protein
LNAWGVIVSKSLYVCCQQQQLLSNGRRPACDGSSLLCKQVVQGDKKDVGVLSAAVPSKAVLCLQLNGLMACLCFETG